MFSGIRWQLVGLLTSNICWVEWIYGLELVLSIIMEVVLVVESTITRNRDKNGMKWGKKRHIFVSGSHRVKSSILILEPSSSITDILLADISIMCDNSKLRVLITLFVTCLHFFHFYESVQWSQQKVVK